MVRRELQVDELEVEERREKKEGLTEADASPRPAFALALTKSLPPDRPRQAQRRLAITKAEAA